MSKSLGNFFTIRDVLPVVRDPEVIRYFFLSSHYRSPLNYSLEQLDQADAALTGIYSALRGHHAVEEWRGGDHRRAFTAAMDDDFNTPLALAELKSLTRALNSANVNGHTQEADALAAELRSLGGVFGLLRRDAEEWLRRPKLSHASAADSSAIPDARVDELVAQRNQARQRKDFGEADRIRDELSRGGVTLEDSPGGATTWRRK
jgi:cysteinyl-tRNA synthetase